MDIFQLRDNLINDYEKYFSSFIEIKDQGIKEKVQSSLNEGFLWPDPLI